MVRIIYEHRVTPDMPWQRGEWLVYSMEAALKECLQHLENTKKHFPQDEISNIYLEEE